MVLTYLQAASGFICLSEARETSLGRNVRHRRVSTSGWAVKARSWGPAGDRSHLCCWEASSRLAARPAPPTPHAPAVLQLGCQGMAPRARGVETHSHRDESCPWRWQRNRNDKF